MTPVVKFILVSIFYTVIVLLLLLVYLFTGYTSFLYGSLLMISFLLMGSYILGQLYPELVDIFQIAIRTRRYEHSKIKGLDLKMFEKRLIAIIEKDRLYLDETISLNKVADLLSVTTHQLSEFLNNNLKLNFNSFINKYRIEEAKRLLKERPEETIISIAFTVGFNNRSSFNAAFLAYTGLTPKEYRKSLS